jgi:hypothetical protein
MVMDEIVVELRWGTNYLMGAASATIAKFLWCVVMILEGAQDPEVSRLAVSVLGGVHAGIKEILAKSKIQSLDGLQRTDSRTAEDERLPEGNGNWGEADLEITAQRLYSGGFGRSRKERQRVGAASVVCL